MMEVSERAAAERQQYRITGQLDLSELKEVEGDVPLRVSAVSGGKVVDSQVLRPGPGGTAPFKLEYAGEGPGRSARLVVTHGECRELEALRAEEVTRRIPAREWKQEKEGNLASVDVGRVVIPVDVYRRWLLLCRRYVIRGRVVCRHWRYDPIEHIWIFEDLPVPGATVEAYDTDCWWWWCFRDLIGSAVTGADGTFEISFWWCCRLWFPFRVPWTIDPDLLRRIRELLAEVRIPGRPPLPDPPPLDPHAFEQYVMSLASAARAGSTGLAQGSRMLMSTQPVELDPSRAALDLKALLPPAPDLEALHVWPWWPRRDCAPDITFRVTQACHGAVEVVYEESAAQTRWNASTTLEVLLEVNDKACCLPNQPDPPQGDCLHIKQVGCVLTDQIGTSAGPPDLRGYAHPGTLDRPFGATLRVRGDFGEAAQDVVDYYRVQYHREGAPAGTWVDMEPVPGLLTPLYNRYFDPGTLAYSPYIPMGPVPVGGRQVFKTIWKYERDNPPPGPPGSHYLWDNWDTLFWWDTTRTPEGDGLYTLRLVTYREGADGSLTQERVIPLCGTENLPAQRPETVMVRVDNRIDGDHPPSTPSHPCGGGTVHLCTVEPDCDFVSIIKNEGLPGQTPILACGDVSVADTDTVTIHFMVTTPPSDKDAHLLAYELTAHYGESGLVTLIAPGTPSFINGALSGDPTPHFGPHYSEALMQGAARPHWHGGHFKLKVNGSAFPVSCAYLLRLRAWKRTTTGCVDPYYFHANVCEFSFCLARP